MVKIIKVNIPDSEKSYEQGNGEGVWATIKGEAIEAYNTDNIGAVYKAILQNDSIYYPRLSFGDEILIEMRGKNRPVVPFEWLDGENFYDTNKN